jgi:pyruvyltransferase
MNEKQDQIRREIAWKRKKNNLLSGRSFGRKIRLPVSYYRGPRQRQNFGDNLNSGLLKLLTGRPVELVPFGSPRESYIVIGSTLQEATERNCIWGPGFISSEEHLKASTLDIKAVRGPLTRDILNVQGITCPSVYGDPAILLPILYPVSFQKQWEIGIVPHYVDQDHPAIKLLSRVPGVRIINVFSPWRHVVRQIASSRYLFSSSLHGLIVADAYAVPCLRFVASDRVTGGAFKFNDYRQGVGGKSFPTAMIDDIVNQPKAWTKECSHVSTHDAARELIRACPFF